MVRIRRPAQLRLQLFGEGVEHIYQQLRQLEEQHVRAVRGLEKLAKALEHVSEAEDAIQETWLRYEASPTPHTHRSRPSSRPW